MHMKSFFSFVLFLLIFACTQQGNKKEAITHQQIESAIANGSFSRAEALIRDYLHANSLPFKEQQKWLFTIDKMNRIRMDFMATDSSVRSFLLNYFDSISDDQMRKWEAGKALEYKIIDGKKFYFNYAARNLFRISVAARKQWEKIHGTKPDSLHRFLDQYIPQVVKDIQANNNPYADPVNMEVTYTLTVKPNAVPPGEMVRVWMPFPRSDVPRQTDVQLISTSQPNFVVAPDNIAHKTIYMEKKAIIDQPTVFNYTFSFTSYAEWYDFNPSNIKLYNTQSDIYQDFTMEQPPHILFSNRIREKTNEVIGNEQNPYIKVRKIYDWIDKNFPWASAREYSTFDNIPEYVLDNRHGDCGQVSLLFITMARCAGIPAKWQSGWMMHPGNKNLHDWAEVYFEGIGWVPVDQSFGRVTSSQNPNIYWYYTKGIDAFRLVVNQDTGRDLFPVKIHSRSETVDFQRGEVEWKGGNLYFDQWRYNMDIVYRPVATTTDSESSKTSLKGRGEYGYGYSSHYPSPYLTVEEDRYKGFYGGLYPFPNGSYPSHYQYYGSNADHVIRNYNQRQYLREGERVQPYPDVERYLPPDRNGPYPYDLNWRDPYQYDTYQYDPSRFDSFRYDSFRNNNSYYPFSRIEDNSVSAGYPFSDRGRTEDRYVPPSERSSFPGGSGYYPPYRRDVRER